MVRRTLRVAVMLDLQWPYKRHADIFAGTQQYAESQGWSSIIDEFLPDTLSACTRSTVPYDGVIARANRALARQAARWKIPVVNVWASSPVRSALPGVFPDYAAAGRMCAEHLLARGFCYFAALTPRKNYGEELEVREFVRLVEEAGYRCLSENAPQSPWRDVAHWRKTERLVHRWMDRWQTPIGVYISQEALGRRVTQECHQRGWRVPADVAIISGQNQET
ncbi:MAG: substrate-binding domain-containing protein, partial [Planctomycetales bacterium]|nr:substrate-binding domain-containing protein [Planctomycetales bacterium]